jgi:outer membrane immunogenic protein
MAALIGSAAAADIPRRVEAARAAPVSYVAPVYNWTGPYVGLFGGWASGDASSFDVDGGLFGATLGYNWQNGQLVFGLEGDLTWTGIDGSGTCGGVACSVENNWLGTVRGRLGLAIDRFMPYVTAGVAFGEVEANAVGFAGASDTQTGWALGGGVEFAVAPPLTVKLEYLFVNLGDFDCGTACGGTPTNIDFEAHMVRVGLNYRF